MLGLAECLREWLDHRREVLSGARATASARSTGASRSCGGLLIVYLDLDRVIKIIREEDEPKQELMRASSSPRFRQRHPRHAPALLAQARGDGAEARARRADEGEGQIEELLGSEKTQWKTVTWQIREVRKTFGPERDRTRRTSFADAPDTSEIDFAEAMVEREPITVIVSRRAGSAP